MFFGKPTSKPWLLKKRSLRRALRKKEATAMLRKREKNVKFEEAIVKLLRMVDRETKVAWIQSKYWFLHNSVFRTYALLYGVFFALVGIGPLCMCAKLMTQKMDGAVSLNFAWPTLAATNCFFLVLAGGVVHLRSWKKNLTGAAQAKNDPRYQKAQERVANLRGKERAQEEAKALREELEFEDKRRVTSVLSANSRRARRL